jgi:TonB family protein
MPDNILVVEREPRDAELVREALAGQPFNASFVREDGDVMRALDASQPKLIVLPSEDLIGMVRMRPGLQKTPIVVLPHPFSPADFLVQVQQMLHRHGASVPGQLTSNDIFGDLVEEEKRSGTVVSKPLKRTDDVDKLLAETLSGVMPKAKKTHSGTGALDKKLQDTLSGLEKGARAKTTAGTVRVPKVEPPPESTPAPRPEPPQPQAPPRAALPFVEPPQVEEEPEDIVGERTHLSEPVFPPEPPPAVEEEPTDGTKFGQYVLLQKIASGGMAEVWKARMRGVEGFQKIVAIKRILPHLSDNQEFIEMFIDEAKMAAQLNHGNIIHIYDLGKIQNSYYIAMEYVEGADLKTILKRSLEHDQPMSIELALFITSKVAGALDYAHRKDGLVHRDVSPQNILISLDGDIKLCDFGIAKAASKASHTQVGALKGKLQYMSPEQAWGRKIDRRSDIFALAAVLFELLTRRKLFLGDNEMSVLDLVRDAKVYAPSQFNEEVTPHIDAMVLKALEKDPEDRYQTAGEFAKDIDSLLYHYRPTPTNADVAIFMHRLASVKPFTGDSTVIQGSDGDWPPWNPPGSTPVPAQPVAAPAPVVEEEPAEVAAPAAAATYEPYAPEAAGPLTQPQREKRINILPFLAAAGVAVVLIGGYLFMRPRAAEPAATVAVAPPSPEPVATTPAPATTQTIVPVNDSAAASVATATSTAPVLDAAKINEEVQRRLAAERARLEEASREPAPAARPQPQPVSQRPTPVPQPQAQPVAPQPAPVESTVAPVQPAPQPAAETRPAPAPAPAPEPTRVHEGDMVTDLDGLVPARMIRRASVAYPPMARMQRVVGTVLVGALISETGAVMQTRIIKPINKPVGLNEAAEQIVRRSSFSAPMKDGVRVKAWTTVPIDFKL